jgi:YD repeat-containing protein
MYDALGRRIAITNATTGVTTDLYYSGSNVIEERQGGTVMAQYVWGLEYVNDLVLRDRYNSSSSCAANYGTSTSGLNERLYVEQDANYDVTSLTDASGNVLERFAYDPYGNMIVLTGTTTWTTTTDSYNWVYTWQGGRLDQVTGFIRFDAGGDGRDVNTQLGVAMEQDPFEGDYIDGANLYQWEVSNPVNGLDPTGQHRNDPLDDTQQQIDSNIVGSHGLSENHDGVANWNNNIDYYKGLGNQALQNQLNNLRDLALAMARQLADQAVDSVNPFGMFGFHLSQWGPIKHWLDKQIPCPNNPYANKAAPWVIFALASTVGDAAGGLGAAGEGEAAASEADEAAAETTTPRETPYNDPQQPNYNNGATQMDHEDAKIWGGQSANRPLPAETNMRRGGFDGALYRDYQKLIDQGMSEADARAAVHAEIDALKNSPPPRPIDPDILDHLPSNPEQ